MFTAEWRLALELQAAIALSGVAVATLLLGIPFRTAALAAALFNSIPVGTPPGFATPLFLQDLVVPVFAVLLLYRYRQAPLVPLALAAIVAWPLAGVLLGKAVEPAGNDWIPFVFRRVGLLVFFATAASGALPDVDLGDFLDSCALLWIGMAAVGMLQFYGVVQADPTLRDAEVREATILESVLAQRGFLGLNRGAVGVWGAVTAACCLARLLMDRAAGVGRQAVHVFSLLLSGAVILFAGSRTGLAACAAGCGYVSLQALRRPRHARFRRVFPVAAAAAAAFLFVVAPVLEVVGTRLLDMGSSESVALRGAVQGDTIRYVLGHARAAAFGMGVDGERFRALVGTELSHPHSEYVEILWQAGIPGLALYLWFLRRLFRSAAEGDEPDASFLAVRGMTVAGLVSGLAVGYVMITNGRLAPFGMAMLFVYGLTVRRSALRGALPGGSP